MWERGLKLFTDIVVVVRLTVAPHVGAWIETYLVRFCRNLLRVAPHVGAWIET